MINLKDIKNQKYSDIKIVEILFYTFPLSFIIGNLVLSIHLLIFLIISSLCIFKNKINIRFGKQNFLLLIFFLYLFLSTAIQFPDIYYTWTDIRNINYKTLTLENHPIFKSFLLFRFLILIVILDALFFNKILNLKKFFYFSLLCTSFVSIDIFIQYIYGYDLFGYKSLGERNPGPFGEESVAGSYLQRFGFISIFSILLINFENKKKNKILLFFIIIFLATAILLSGNRMPMILFLFGCLLMILFMKNFRITTLISLAVFILIFSSIYSNNENIRNNYSRLLYQINVFEHIKLKNIFEKKVENKQYAEKQTKNNFSSNLLKGGYSSLYKTSIEIWKEQPLFGYGLKSFRYKCWEILYKTGDKSLSCSTHSHNYYFELLIEAGIIGIVLIVTFFILLIKDTLYFVRKNNRKINTEIIFMLPIIITIFLEIWPIKSSGSFFTTSNATFLWLMVGILFSTSAKNVNKKL